MPLIQGHTKASIHTNIQREVRAGRPRKQAVAIALGTARTAWRKTHKKGRFPKHLTRKSGAH